MHREPLNSCNSLITLPTRIVQVAIACWIYVFCMVSEVNAGGASTNGVATRAQSMQGAFTAVADDASAVFYNPAGLTQLKGTSIYGSIFGILPEIEYTSSVVNETSTSNRSSLGVGLFASTDMLKQVYLGIGVYSPFARATDYNVNHAVGGVTQRSKLLRIDAVPTIAFQVKDIAVGVGFVASKIEFESDILGLDESGDGLGFSGQVGVLYSGLERIKLGVTYRGPMTAHIDGSGTLAGVGSDNFNADLKFPAVLSFGGAIDASSSLTLAVNIDWEMWSSFDAIRREYTNPILNAAGAGKLDATDSYTVRIGVLKKLNRDAEIRAGYSYTDAAIPADNIIPGVPDFNIHSFSIGYSKGFQRLRVDLGYEFQYGPDRTNQGLLFPGDYTLNLHTILFGVAYEL